MKLFVLCRMATLNQYATAYDYSQYYPAGAQYDQTTGQYYDPQTGQYYDYSQYYQQYENDKNTQSKWILCTGGKISFVAQKCLMNATLLLPFNEI